MSVLLLTTMCGPAGFDPISQIESVRVLAASASEPYAKPGDMVTVTLDTYDGRPTNPDAGTPSPMTVYWLPFVCEDPLDDLYYACFSSVVAGADGGTGGGMFPANLDISDLLPQGPSYPFTMPADVISSHAFTPGLPEQYGLAIVFAMVCAGRVRTLPIDLSAGNGQTVPLGCFDGQGNQLSAKDYVFTFARVYAYENATNANPVISSVTFDGQTVDTNVGVVVDACSGATCPTHSFGVVVPDASWELATGTPPEPDGTTLHEEVWADYFTTVGSLQNDGILLFDARTGRVPNADNQLTAPNTPGPGRLFVVVHDNRGGASWVDFPVNVR